MKEPQNKLINVLETRLNLLNQYIISHPNKNFAEWLHAKGIGKSDFLVNMPAEFKNVPINNYKKLVEYTGQLNDEYYKQSQELEVQKEIFNEGKHVFKPINYMAADAKYFNGDGMGYINSADDPDNWVEAVTYPEASEATLRWALSRAWYFINEYGRQVEEHIAQGNTENAEYVGRKLDDVASLIDWLTKRINGSLTAQQAAQAFEERHQYDQQLMAQNNKAVQPKGAFNKLKATLDEAAKIAKQNWYSIGAGLKLSPKEILDNLKKEAQKALDAGKEQSQALLNEAKKNIGLFNRFNPVAVAGRASLMSMLELNVFGLASAFAEVKTKPDVWAKVLTKWSNLGGEPAKFSKQVEDNKNKPRMLEGVLRLVKKWGGKNADGSDYMAATAEEVQKLASDVQKANDEAKKVYDKAKTQNDKLKVAANALGITAGSGVAAGGIVALIPGAQNKVIGGWVAAGSSMLVPFIPIINGLKEQLGLPPDNSTPDADPSKVPPSGDDGKDAEQQIGPDSDLPSFKAGKQKLIGGIIVVVLFLGSITAIVMHKKPKS